MTDTRLSQLPGPWQQLVVLMKCLGFGEVRDLHVQDGRPFFEPRPRVVRTIRLGGSNRPSEAADDGDFVVKRCVLDLIARLEEVGAGRVLRLGVKHGLPTDLAVEQEHGIGLSQGPRP